MQRSDGMNYAPENMAREKVVGPGEFVFAATHFDHGHLVGQCNGLVEAGGTLKYVFDEQPERARALAEKFEGAEIVDDFRRVLDDPEVRLVASAAVPSQRCGVGLRVMDAGKDYFTDKCPFTTPEQLELARAKAAETGRKYMVYYSERIHVESSMHATALVRGGAVGKLVQILLLAPHRLNKASRPGWFFDKASYGGIITDIGCHQCDQCLAFTGATDGTVEFARVANMNNPDTPGLEDFGEVAMTMSDGTACYYRLDWFTPDGLPTWGDGRVFVIGTEGSMEIRKYVNLGGAEGETDVIFLTDREGVRRIDCKGKVGTSFFGGLILDCLNRTEEAMTQAHAFKAAELSLRAQAMAEAAG